MQDKDVWIFEEYSKRNEICYTKESIRHPAKGHLQMFREIIKRYSKKADINKNISPHILRHTFATEYYRQTKDIETLRRILGHADISTTTIYITLANIDVENGMKSFKGFL